VRSVPAPANIVVADDSVELRNAMKMALEAAGHSVRLAGNGSEALALQREMPGEVLITDIFMPDSDGFEAIASFHEEFPQTKIIAISGDAARVKQEYLSVAALLGVDATLAKPFDIKALLETLNSVRSS
jgi:CheY-like chemotaxis protein